MKTLLFLLAWLVVGALAGLLFCAMRRVHLR